MARATVKIYDDGGNFIEELPYGTNGITGTNGTGQGQVIYAKTDENGKATYFPSGMAVAKDPFEKIGLDIDEYTEIQAPQVKIENGAVTLNAPKDVLASPLAEQIRQELQSLKGANLEDQSTKDAIEALNEEIRNTVHNWTLRGTLGWSEDEFKDYNRLLQAMRQANPLSSTETFYAKRPGADFYYKDEEGREMMKMTPNEWINYWRENYSVDEREDMYEKSLESTDPYERVMALIMSGGLSTDKDERGYNKIMYGYDAWERLGKFWQTVGKNLRLFPMGVARRFMSGEDDDYLQDLATSKGIDAEKVAKGLEFVRYNSGTNEMATPWAESEEAFNRMWDEVKGKTEEEMSDAEKLFVLETKVADRSARKKEMGMSLYDRVKELDQTFWKLAAYEDEVKELEESKVRDSMWAEGNVGAGNVVGTIGRFAWESAVGKALTGYSMNKISDAIGAKIVGGLTNAGISPTSAVGQGALQSAANLIGTIPEDIVQDAVDNIVTYNDEQNQYLLDPAQMGENFKNNLLFMAAWNAGIAGINSARKIKLLLQLKKAADLSEELDFPESDLTKTLIAASDAADVTSKGGHFETEDGKVYAVDIDGNRTVLNGVTQEQAKIMQSAMEKAQANERAAFAKLTENMEATRILADGGTIEVRDGGVYAVDVNGNRVSLGSMTVGEAKAISKVIRNREAARIIANGGTIEVRDGKVYGVDSDGARTELNNITVEEADALNRATSQGAASKILADGAKVEIRGGKVYAVYPDGTDTVLDDLTVEDGQALNRVMSNREALRVLQNGGTLEVRDGNVYAVSPDGNSIEVRVFVEDARTLSKIMSDREAASILADGGTVEVRNGKVYAVDVDGRAVEMGGLTVGDAQMLNKAVSNREAVEILSNGGKLEVRDGKVYAVGEDGRQSEISGLTVGDAAAINNALTVETEGRSKVTGTGTLNLPKEALAKLEQERDSVTKRINELEAQRKAWIENGYKDEDGNDVRQREQTDYSLEEVPGSSKLERLDYEIDTMKKRIDEIDDEKKVAEENVKAGSDSAKYDEAAEAARKNAQDAEPDGTPKAQDSESSGKVSGEETEAELASGVSRYTDPDATPVSTGYKSIDDAINTKPISSPRGLLAWFPRRLKAILDEAQTNLFREFRSRFGDVRASDFDWVYKNIDEGKTIKEIIGTTDTSTQRVITQNMIDAMKWWADHPMVRIFREMSRESLGKNGDYNKLGYLPHTTYDPLSETIEEAKAGQLWKRYTGKSMQNEAGDYVGFGGDLESRYRTYVSNMLWDMNNKEVLAAKLIEEAEMDGKKLTPDEALKMADEVKRLDEKVNNSKSSKSMEKGATKDGSDGIEDFKKAVEEVKKEAPKSGTGKAIHDAWGEAYVGYNQGEVISQPENIGEKMISLNDQADVMRKIKVKYHGQVMDMYNSGGGDLVYAHQNAIELVNRVDGTGGGWKQPIVEFIKEHSGRSEKYADIIADKILAKAAKKAKGGKITKEAMISSLSKSFRSEAWSRLRRFLVIAKFEGQGSFNAGTTAFINDFTFRHIQMDNLVNNKGILAKLADALTNLRYDALFYGNLKNALLQVSELSRLFTSFKLGDVGSMLKRLATDADFRERVDLYVQVVAPESKRFNASLYDSYGDASDSMRVKDDGVHFKKFKQGWKTVDNIALAPIESAEALKNRTLIAALVAEADRLRENGYIKSDNEYLMYIRRRFERVGLAQNEMGKLGMSSSPLVRPLMFLQNFQIRELGMHYYNIFDPDDLETGGKIKDTGASKGKMRWEGAKYLMKVLGTKLGTTLILARLGYSAAQTLGLDPFGLANNYDGLSEDERTWVDDQISHGVLTPLVSSGITSLAADMYFMAREAYEDAHRSTAADEARENLNGDQNGFNRTDWSFLFEPNTWGNFFSNFIPGQNTANRIDQMNQMMSTGWATSNTGNKMYTAPDDPWNTLKGYLFGRSATQNALDYNQNYGDNLGQTLSRTAGKFFADMFGGGYNELDAIDQQNFTDWFDGSDNDTQQFEKGRRAFRAERDRILDAYETAIRESYGSSEDEAQAVKEMNDRLDDLYEKVGRFVDAYERQHGTITGKMVKQIISLLNQGRPTTSGSQEERDKIDQAENDKAVERYVQYGFPNVGTYTGSSKKYPNTELKYQGSPQWRVKSGARWNVNTEAALVLDAADAALEDLRSQMKTLYSDAVQNNDYTEFNKAQTRYLEAFDNAVGPVIATYGNGILSNKDVKRQLEDMLMTSSSGTKVNLIPFDQYGLDKYGRRRSMPTESVDVSKWAKERYSSDIFKNANINSSSSTQDDIDTIRRMIDNGQTGMARARALSLKVRIDNQRRTISDSDYQWLLNFLNNGGTQ